MNKVTLKIKNFDPEAIFTCGQCFRWVKEKNGSYTGVAKNKVINVSSEGENVTFLNISESEFREVWEDYFDLKRDYETIIDVLSGNEVLKESVQFGKGIKILRQDFFECLISFIISANNNIPRIQKIINTLSRLYGEKITFNGMEYYSFPSPESLRNITEKDLEPLHAGYRAKYIVKAVNQFLSGEVDFERIKTMPEKEARESLMKISGVGPKVADCILLFAFGRFDVFPTDVWVKRVMGELFGAEEKKACEMGKEMFGEYAGIAQQYLFYKRRSDNQVK